MAIRKYPKHSAGAMVLHWRHMGAVGRMAPPTATQFANACRRALSILDDWRELDLRDVDVEDVVNGFRRAYADELEPVTLQTYESIFRRAVPSYLAYVEDAASWEPPVNMRSKVRAATQRTAVVPEGLHEFAIPLPSGNTARLTLPVDLTESDARLLLEVLPAYVKAGASL